jgi:hypothetical protein
LTDIGKSTAQPLLSHVEKVRPPVPISLTHVAATLKTRFGWAPNGIVLAILVFGGLMNDGSAANVSRTWQTDKMTLLDNREFINAAVRAVNGGIPGTNKQYDANKVSLELTEMLFNELKDTSGVHAETALAALGALAGFAGQMAIREALIKTGKMQEDQAFVVVKTRSGDPYYFGDLLNEILFENKPGSFSISGLVGGAAQHSGAKQLPDIKNIADHVAGTVGSDTFGVPRLPPNHMPRNKPIELLDKFWSPVRNFLVVNVQSPAQWPLVIALAAQKVIVMAKGTIDPALAAGIVIEAAIAMAKVDPARIHFAHFQSY